MQVQRLHQTPGGAKLHDSVSCGSWDYLASSTTNIPYGNLLLLVSLPVYSHNSIWGCRLTTPDFFLHLSFLTCKKTADSLLYLQCRWMQHPTVPRYCFEDFLNTMLAHKGGRLKFIASANHSNHICTRKHCSSQGATPSVLTTVRSTTEPLHDVSQSVCSLEQMNTHSTLWF